MTQEQQIELAEIKATILKNKQNGLEIKCVDSIAY